MIVFIYPFFALQVKICTICYWDILITTVDLTLESAPLLFNILIPSLLVFPHLLLTK